MKDKCFLDAGVKRLKSFHAAEKLTDIELKTVLTMSNRILQFAYAESLAATEAELIEDTFEAGERIVEIALKTAVIMLDQLRDSEPNPRPIAAPSVQTAP